MLTGCTKILHLRCVKMFWICLCWRCIVENREQRTEKVYRENSRRHYVKSKSTWYELWFKNKTSLTLEISPEAYSEPCQTSKMNVFAKIVKAPSQMYGKILYSPLKPATICGKSSISSVWQGFEFTFLLIIFAKLFPIYLLNLINIFHHISVLCTVKSTWPYVQHICLITKIIMVFPNHVFLLTMIKSRTRITCILLHTFAIGLNFFKPEILLQINRKIIC